MTSTPFFRFDRWCVWSIVASVLAGFIFSGTGAAIAQSPVGVKVENRSEPVLCAEKDNVTLAFSHPKVTQFRIEAAHPNYINTLQKDSFAPDWTACEFAEEAKAQPPPPRKVTLYEDVNLWVVGYSFANFWRDRKVPFRVGVKSDDSLHVVQVWVRQDERAEEVLVVYPTDGYWRARPLPPKHLGWSAYGSSFLVGPVEDAGRPVVNLSEIVFDPKARAFTLKFAGGGSANLNIARLDREAQVLDVTFSEPIAGPPFAALRSMYVTRFNNDVAEVGILETGASSWLEEPIMKFKGAASANEVWTGRLFPSRHNTSAPDTVFRKFKGPPQAVPKEAELAPNKP